MPKRVIQATIENEEEKVTTKTTAIYQDNIIKYKEKDNTMVIYNYNKKKLIRENKELNKTINISIKTKKIEEEKINSYIEFEIDKDVFKYEIEAIK